MKEVTFIRRNIDKWHEFEAVAEAGYDASPAAVADAYIDVTSDLSYAQTRYPRSRITLYLNHLAAALHQQIYRNKGERWSRLWTFWRDEVPQVMYLSRRELWWSVLIFLVGMAVGVVSQCLDSEFCRLIMGNSYVEMTLDNISKGEPMGVYGTAVEDRMFLAITMNNIKVSFLVFVAGLLTSLGTGFILLQNGIMLGTFQAFLSQQGVLMQSLPAIWLHGTLEISAIVVAGAAGIAMGNGWLFPDTYSRMRSFRMGAKRGLKIVIGTVPIFCVAGFIESFLTRHTEWPDAFRLSIIGLSAAFVAYYFVILPHRRYGIQKT